MFQGQGGHGSVVAAKLLAQTAAAAGFHAQSFASYGALRRGGKVEGYVRISKEMLFLRCKMYRADYLVVMDEALVEAPGTVQAAKEDGSILINTAKSANDFPFLEGRKVFTVDAYSIAARQGLIIPGGMPVINTTLLGALAGICELPLNHVMDVIRKGTPNPGKNAECAAEGYRRVKAPSVDPTAVGVASIRAGGRVPVYDAEKMKTCHRCQICYMGCPNVAIHFEENPLRFYVDKEACSGCGICIHECPRSAISWKE
jgi:pyruvate ferredoxin oxidoreductase gamma subunit